MTQAVSTPPTTRTIAYQAGRSDAALLRFADPVAWRGGDREAYYEGYKAGRVQAASRGED